MLPLFKQIAAGTSNANGNASAGTARTFICSEGRVNWKDRASVSESAIVRRRGGLGSAAFHLVEDASTLDDAAR